VTRPRFGEQRLHDENKGLLEKLWYRALGVADPAHYLHWRYLSGALDSLRGFAPQRILDAGCGAGDYSFYLARLFPEATVLGIDIDEKLIVRNKAMAGRLGIRNVDFEARDLSGTRFPEQFDFVLSIDVLEHVEAQEQAIANLCASLKHGGIAYFHIPTVRERPVPFHNRLAEFRAWAEREHVARERMYTEFIEVVRRHLVVIRVRRTFGYFTGELATSLFAMPYRNTLFNRVEQVLLAPICRALAIADSSKIDGVRYAVAVLGSRP